MKDSLKTLIHPTKSFIHKYVLSVQPLIYFAGHWKYREETQFLKFLAGIIKVIIINKCYKAKLEKLRSTLSSLMSREACL